MLEVRPATRADVISLAPRLREADLEEAAALNLDPFLSLIHSMQAEGAETQAIVKGELVIGLFGYVPYVAEEDGECAVVWAVGSPEVEDHPIGILKISKRWTEEFQKKFDTLTNLIDSRNELHLKWLRWCGMKLTGEYMIGGVKFYSFVRKR